jgi:hypothetical protein
MMIQIHYSVDEEPEVDDDEPVSLYVTLTL